MDIRIEKTERAIKNAFIELRSQKPLEKITVIELCRLACINKSTFYSHYEDIFALSDGMEEEIVNSILRSISEDLEYTMENLEVLACQLYMAFLSHVSLITTVFSGKENSRLGNRIETSIKEMIFEKHPEYREDVKKNILLSFVIQGGYHAYQNNREVDSQVLIRIMEDIARAVKVLYE